MDTLNTPNASRKRWTDLFVQRPMIAVVMCIAIILIGARAATSMPIINFPIIKSSNLVIQTLYVGASAEIVQGFITEPIEGVARAIPGVDYVESTSIAGMSTVTVWLSINEDSTAALAELSARLEQIKFLLPEAAEDPAVTVIRADSPFSAFYLVARATSGMSNPELSDYLARHILPILSTMDDVKSLGLWGNRLPAMRIWLDPIKMVSMSVSAQDVHSALTQNNVIATIGRSENNSQQVNLQINTALKSVEDFEQIVIRDDNGALVRMQDVARVELGQEEGDSTSRSNYDNEIFIGINTEPGSNDIAVGNQLYKTLDSINEVYGDDLNIIVGNDNTRYMREALIEIFITLAETIFLVGLVVFLFMGSIRTALVPLVAIPVSLLGAIAATSAMGFSLNILTVLAIVLSVGLVVDDAIVVVENVARKMREGSSRTQAALDSSRQLSSPIVAMTLTLATVYAPIGFLTGLTGALFKEFAFTLAIAVIISGILALTLSPIMSAYVCAEGGKESRFTLKVNRTLSRLEILYGRLLDRTLNSTPQILFVALFFALLVAPFYLFSQQELAPIEDQGTIRFVINAPPEASLEFTSKATDQLVDIGSALPGAKSMWQVLGPGGGIAGELFHPFDDRPNSVHELVPGVFQQVSGIAALQIFPILSAPLPTAGNFSVELVVQSGDTPIDMLPFAEQLRERAIRSGLFITADKDLQIDLQQGEFILNRDRVADLGMSLSDVSQQIGLLMSGNYVNRFDLDGRAYKVIPMLELNGRPDPDALMNLEIQTPDGSSVPLSGLATLNKQATPRFLRKFEQKNAFRVFGLVRPGVTNEQGLSFLEQAAQEILPAGYTLDYAGESRQLRQEGNTLFGVLGLALVFVFLVLAVQFNSFRDPVVILAGSVPLALSGAMMLTFVGWTSINIYSQIGFITLVGLISKNAILIVEFAKQLQMAGRSKYEAIREAATIRLRPVLMTTGATVMGHFPLVLVSGAGAEARNSIGIILVAGMLIGSLFTLIVLPNIYLLFASTHKKGEWGTDESDATALPELASQM
ncbi:MAG: MMPL family transporter [Proteobacteria bacterium]|jgi:multidrug efflux pump|nr:MMPL family transporter [Pseudomonadota bacterium]